MSATLQACCCHVVVPLHALLARVVDHVAQEVDELVFARCASQAAQVMVPLVAHLALVVGHVAQEVDELDLAIVASCLSPERPGFDPGRFRRKGFRQYYNICTSKYS